MQPAIIALLAAAAIVACDASTPSVAGLGPTPIDSTQTRLVITPNQVSMPVATTTTLSVNVPNQLLATVSWTSSQPSIASVNNLGIVTALSPGAAIIVARFIADTTNRATATVTVTPIGAPQ